MELSNYDQVTLTREGDFIRSSPEEVDEVNFSQMRTLFFFCQVNIFDGASNRITFEQVYSKKFKCEYKLGLYPFDTQVSLKILSTICEILQQSSLRCALSS